MEESTIGAPIADGSSARRFGLASGPLLAFVRGHCSAAMFVLYLGIAVALELPALEHLDSICACAPSPDPSAFMWALTWWPHAIIHGLNPFVTHEIWSAPGGFNLAAVTSTPAEALLAYPVTALAGPLVSYNLLTVLAPAVGAWLAYRLCAYVTKSEVASAIGGYLFGFSSYELGHLPGHLHLIVTFAVPAVALLTLQRIDGVVSRRRYVVLMVLLLAFQLLTSSEVLATLTGMTVITFACALIFAPPQTTRRIAQVLPELAGAYVAAAVICSPFLYYALSGPAQTGGPLAIDSLNFALPTRTTWLGSAQFSSLADGFSGHDLSESVGYLGLPLIVIVFAFAIERWRQFGTRILITVLGVAAVLSLGDHLHIDGHQTITLPWNAGLNLPLFKQVIPARFPLYVALASALAAALWLSVPGRHPWRWVLGGLSVLCLLPNVNARTPVSLFHTSYSTPPLFRTDLYRHYLRRNELILPLPFGHAGYSLLWQARTDLYFRMASGTFGAYIPPNYPPALVAELERRQPTTAQTPAMLRQFISSLRITAVVADPAQSGPWLGVLSQIGLHPVAAGGVLIYRVYPSTPGTPGG